MVVFFLRHVQVGRGMVLRMNQQYHKFGDIHFDKIQETSSIQHFLENLEA